MRKLAPLLVVLLFAIQVLSGTDNPAPTTWPERFHSLLYTNLSADNLQIVDMWYDWPRGRNLYLRQYQLGVKMHAIEWDNGTSYYYTLAPDEETCDIAHYPVGILRPDWLAGGTYIGQRRTDGFLCHVWTKEDFIWYYEDVHMHVPVQWDFFNGMSTRVFTFEVGAFLEDSESQAPSYCFRNNSDSRLPNRIREKGSNAGGYMDHSIRRLAYLSSK